MGFRYALLEAPDELIRRLEEAENRSAPGSNGTDPGRENGSRTEGAEAGKAQRTECGQVQPSHQQACVSQPVSQPPRFTAHAVYSDMTQTAAFTSGSAALDRLFQNCLWSMKSNFCGVPTDCPTRERAGWTGDAAVFAHTGLRLMSSAPVFESWLGECRLNQYEDGRIANIAPRNGRPSFFTGMLAGSVGWGDACIQVPWEIYCYTGNRRVLEENYPMMQRWYAYLTRRAAKTPLRKRLHFGRDPYEKYTIDTGIDYGEWCEPGIGTESMREKNRSEGTAYLYYSGKLLGDIAETLGRTEDAASCRRTAEMARLAYLRAFTEAGEIRSERMKEYVRPLKFGILQESEAVSAAADALDALVRAQDFHLNTGFLSTPFLCEVLAEHGHADTAYELLLQESAPSWLYEVKRGATTIWERWEGIGEDGVPKDSLNHYAYGAIAGWMLEGVCGIRYTYGKLRIEPVTDRRLGHAEGSLTTPQGRVSAGWAYRDDHTLDIYCTVPEELSAEVKLPDGRFLTVEAGRHRWTVACGENKEDGEHV